MLQIAYSEVNENPFKLSKSPITIFTESGCFSSAKFMVSQSLSAARVLSAEGCTYTTMDIMYGYHTYVSFCCQSGGVRCILEQLLYHDFRNGYENVKYCKSTNFGVLLYLANLANCVFSLIFVPPTFPAVKFTCRQNFERYISICFSLTVTAWTGNLRLLTSNVDRTLHRLLMRYCRLYSGAPFIAQRYILVFKSNIWSTVDCVLVVCYKYSSAIIVPDGETPKLIVY